MHISSWGRVNLARRHRSDLLIINEILGLVRERGEVKKTHIMNAVNLNSNNAARYLNLLVSRGLLEEIKSGREVRYRLTPLGVRAHGNAKALVDIIYGPPRPRRDCGELKALHAGEDRLMIELNVYLMSSSGLRYPVDYYVPEAGTAIVEVPEADPELVQEAVHRVISMALARPTGLERIIVIARNGYAANIRMGVNQALSRALDHAEVRVVSSCREAVEAVKEALGEARLGPHTAPHRALGP